MCMKVKGSSKYIKARKDISVVTIKEKTPAGVYYPLVFTDWGISFPLNQVIKDENFQKRILKSNIIFYAFHLTPADNLANLQNSLKLREWSSGPNTVILKGYIPKGSLYIRGFNIRCSASLDDKPAICANQVIFTEEVSND